MRPDHSQDHAQDDSQDHLDDSPRRLSRRERHGPNVLTAVLFGLLGLVMAIQVAC